MAKRLSLAIIISAMIGFISPAFGQDSPESRLSLNPSHVEINMFYNGVIINAEAVVPQIESAALLCRGEDEEMKLNKKGKVYGILWMNVGKITFNSVPSLYILKTTDKINDENSAALDFMHLGYNAMKQDLGPEQTADNNDISLLSEQLIKLKESEGLFKIVEGGVKINDNGNGTVRVTSSINIPAKVKAGRYQVSLYGFQSGRGRLLAGATLTVEQGGAALFISSLSRNHGLLYGVLAVLIALMTGLITGLIFGLGSKGH